MANLEHTTPVGRIVDGNIWKKKPVVDYTTKKPKLKEDGTPRSEFYFGLAIPKSSPGFNDMWGKIYTAASQAYPNGVKAAPGQPLPNLGSPLFTWKIDDGDDPKYAQKTGFAGNWIMRFSTEYDTLKRINPEGHDIVEESQIKTGDYVDVFVGINGGGHADNPSVFLNPSIIRFNSFGEAINNGGPDVSAMAPAAAAIGSTAPIGGAPMAGAVQQQYQQPPVQQQYQQPPQQNFTGAPVAGHQQPPQVPPQGANVVQHATSSHTDQQQMGNPPAPTVPGQ